MEPKAKGNRRRVNLSLFSEVAATRVLVHTPIKPASQLFVLKHRARDSPLIGSPPLETGRMALLAAVSAMLMCAAAVLECRALPGES
jgi:hypothetical protein